MNDSLLVINAGSSTIKFALFSHSDLALIYHGTIDNILEKPQFTVLHATNKQETKQSVPEQGFEHAWNYLFDWLDQETMSFPLVGVGHRVVHGGTFQGPCLITETVLNELTTLNSLAPLHQPHNIAAIQAIKKRAPNLTQIACFDTTFHQTQNRFARLFAIPHELSEQGIIRYGFHGISYEYIASQLPDLIKDIAKGKVIVAHLGQGASMCALENGRSVATSMGFTALDGLMMGTRCGRIDPGVLIYLLQEKKYSIEQINHLLYRESGLLGVSGLSSDMRVLQASTDPRAIEAIELFCYRAVGELGSLYAYLSGCDAIIFTGGIGEHSALVRKKIIDQLNWLGAILEEPANASNQLFIHHKTSKVIIAVIPTQEEYMIAKHARCLMVAKMNNH
jgi:acetate kinase